MNPRIVLVIAGLTIREITRRRILWVLAALSLISVALVGWGVNQLVSMSRVNGIREAELEIGVSQILILIAFMFSFVLAMSAAFLAAPAIASDVESGTVLAMLARPMHRADLIVGRWLGLGIIVAVYAAGSGLLAISVVGYVTGYSPPSMQLALAYLAFQAVAVMTAALALGSRLPGIAAGAITVVLFGLGWFTGVLGAVATAFGADQLNGVGHVYRLLFPTDGLWRGVIYGLEPAAVVLATRFGGRVAESNPFYADAPPPTDFIVWSVVWVLGVLALGAWLFRRREL
jgi:ABC-type transport system involved in multi-copper enzyme maturation permease subunit